jgi:O-antigen ligase
MRNERLIILCALAIVVGTPILDEFDISGITRGVEIYGIVTLTYLWRLLVFLFAGAMAGLLVAYRTSTRHPTHAQTSGLKLCWFMYFWLSFSSILSFSSYFDLALASYRLLEWFIALVTIQLLISTDYRQAMKTFCYFLRIAPIISLVILALVWIYNPYLTYFTSISGYSRLGGVAIHPNGLGLLLGFGALFWCITGRHNKLWFLIACSLMLACLLTKSRSGIGGASMTAVVYLALRSLVAKKASNASIAAVLFLFSGLTLFALFYLDMILPYFLRGEDISYVLDAAGRLDVWFGALDIIKESPIFGHGFIFGPKLLMYSSYVPIHWKAGHAHNDFLNMAIAGGVIGTLFMITIYVKIFLNSLRMIRTEPLLIAMFIGLFVANLFETGLSTSVGVRGFLLIALLRVVTTDSINLSINKHENPHPPHSLPTTRR